MKTPAFWQSKNMLSTALLPLSTWYDMAGVLRRAMIKPAVLPVPMICVGNVTAGGAGKTPVALHIGRRLKERNVNAFFLSRGYGGALPGPLRVDPARHTAHQVGDEPLLLASVLPTVVAKDRLAGAQLALRQGAQAIVMDDGFQNPAIAKTLSLLVIDGQYGVGNGRVMPAGPLRELLSAALNRAHAVVVINRTAALPPLPEGKLLLTAQTRPVLNGLSLKGKKILPFCGIARPEKFFSMLSGLGADMVDTAAFPDHYAYKEADLKKLVMASSRQRAALITTPKDFVRIPAAYRDCMAVVDMALAFDDEALLEAVLDNIVGTA